MIRALIAFFAFFSSLFDRRTVGVDVDEGVTESVAEESILNAEPKGEASWITTGVEIFAFILVVLFLCYVLYRLIGSFGSTAYSCRAFFGISKTALLQ